MSRLSHAYVMMIIAVMLIMDATFKTTGATKMKTFLTILILMSLTSKATAQNDLYNVNLGAINEADGAFTGSVQNSNLDFNNYPQPENLKNQTQNNETLGVNIYQNPNNVNLGNRQNPNTTYKTQPGTTFNPRGNPSINQPKPRGRSSNPELKDFGVQPIAQLYTGNFHSPTPTSIPGGRVITTRQFQSMVQQGRQMLIFDVLGSYEHIPGAVDGLIASNPGSFSDQTQQIVGQYLSQATNNNKQVPILFYCQSAYCWMSYNASLRAINLGYTNVYWYRGGIEAWKSNGLTVQALNQQPQYTNPQYQQPQYQQPQYNNPQYQQPQSNNNYQY